MSSINLLDQPDVRNRLDQCIHCGLCLPACPTYVLDHVEMDSPRGRIALIRAAADGRVEVGGAFQQHIDLCLGCRACETACPSGVEYGFLLETARTAIAEADRFGLGSSDRSRNDTTAPAWFLRLGGRIVQWIGLRQLMPHRPRLRLLARLLAAYQRLGLANVAQRLTRLPAPLRVMIGMVPSLTLDYPDMRRPAPPLAPKRGAVAFFTGCVQDAFLANVNAATIRVLQRNGYEVHFPEGQTCCGAASLHTGDAAFAAALARKNVDAFSGDGFTAIINNAGGCGATLKEYAHLLRDDPRYAERARAFVGKVQDISEFLADHLHNPPAGYVQARVTYVDSCHLRHGQKIVKQPRDLLRQIPGLHLVELNQPDMCCGSAGIYNLLQTQTASRVLDAKLADVRTTNAAIIATANTGCHMQMVYGVKRARLQAHVMHVVELLDRAYMNAA